MTARNTTRLSALAARGEAAASRATDVAAYLRAVHERAQTSKPYCQRCFADLEAIVCGWRCKNPRCRRVTVDVVGSESGIVAREVVR